MNAEKLEERAGQLQEKLELYFVALIFTMLGLAIQTAKFGPHVIATVAELAAWGCLILAGLCAMARLEWLPPRFRTEAKVTQAEENRAYHENYARMDKAAEFHSEIADGQQQITKIDKLSSLAYFAQKVLFVVALALLAVSRSSPAIEALEKSRVATLPKVSQSLASTPKTAASSAAAALSPKP